MHNILIVDDEPNIRGGLEKALSVNYKVFSGEDGKKGLEIFLKEEIHFAILDISMPKLSGFELMKRMKEIRPNVPIVFITGHGTVQSAVEAMKTGAYDFLTKPINLDKLELIIKRALEILNIEQKNIRLTKQVKKFEIDKLIIGESKSITKLKETIFKVGDAKGNVYIFGESGTGKELVCDAIHLLDNPLSPLIKVNCAALSPSLLESELFGHEKGAFTGAVGMKKGRFEMALGGSIFLDEISEIPLYIQVKLLRVFAGKKDREGRWGAEH